MEYLIKVHSILRWWLLAAAIVAIAKAYLGMQRKTPANNWDNRVSLMLIGVSDIQLIVGLILYFTSGLGLNNFLNNGMSFVMHDAYSRFFAMEHILMMIIAIAIMHVGRVKSKKAILDLDKHKKAFWYYLIALLIILASIPWPFRKGFEALGWI